MRTKWDLIVMLLTFGGGALAADPCAAQPAGKKLALLVGCTKYQESSIRSLDGPANDVVLWEKLLMHKFAFPAENITKLVGWPDDPKTRPTRANIVAAWE